MGFILPELTLKAPKTTKTGNKTNRPYMKMTQIVRRFSDHYSVLVKVNTNKVIQQGTGIQPPRKDND